MTDVEYKRFEDVVKLTTYPSGETHSEWKITPTTDLVVEVIVHNWTQLMTVLALDDAASRLDAYPTWFLPFFPFARDDRRRSKYCSSELQTAFDMIDEMGLRDRIVIADPHSYVTERLPHIKQLDIVRCVMKETTVFCNDPVIVIPDTGATHKAMTWATGKYVVQAGKARNSQTGALSGFTLPDYNFEGRPAVIVDDICDGGGTFLGLAEKLKHQGAGPLMLVVTHGLFTKGVLELTQSFDHIVSFGDVPDGEMKHESTLTAIAWRTLYTDKDTTIS